jgi:hypothetical protein
MLNEDVIRLDNDRSITHLNPRVRSCLSKHRQIGIFDGDSSFEINVSRNLKYTGARAARNHTCPE